jgi:hypothetical protein
MLRLGKVFRRVLVLGLVAAPDMPTGEAGAEVHPRVTERATLVTTVGRRRYGLQAIEMRTGPSASVASYHAGGEIRPSAKLFNVPVAVQPAYGAIAPGHVDQDYANAEACHSHH